MSIVFECLNYVYIRKKYCNKISYNFIIVDLKMLAVHGGVGENQTGIEKLCADAARDTGFDVVKAVMVHC